MVEGYLLRCRPSRIGLVFVFIVLLIFVKLVVMVVVVMMVVVVVMVLGHHPIGKVGFLYLHPLP